MLPQPRPWGCGVFKIEPYPTLWLARQEKKALLSMGFGGAGLAPMLEGWIDMSIYLGNANIKCLLLQPRGHEFYVTLSIKKKNV